MATQSESSELQQRYGTLQQEVELVRGQCRELEGKNTQLKSSNQVNREMICIREFIKRMKWANEHVTSVNSEIQTRWHVLKLIISKN